MTDTPTSSRASPAITHVEGAKERKLEKMSGRIIKPLRRRTRPRAKRDQWQPLDLDDSPVVYEDITAKYRIASRTRTPQPESMIDNSLVEVDVMGSPHLMSVPAVHKATVSILHELSSASRLQASNERRPSAADAVTWKQELLSVFGNQLPGNDYVDAEPGTENGQIQFAQDPNGDVSVYQWFSASFEWKPLGQYVKNTSSITGSLSEDTLNGTLTWRGMDDTSLLYFKMLAKQREAKVMSLKFGEREIRAAFPHATATPTTSSLPDDQAAHSPTKSISTESYLGEPHTPRPKSRLRPDSQPFINIHAINPPSTPPNNSFSVHSVAPPQNTQYLPVQPRAMAMYNQPNMNVAIAQGMTAYHMPNDAFNVNSHQIPSQHAMAWHTINANHYARQPGSMSVVEPQILRYQKDIGFVDQQSHPNYSYPVAASGYVQPPQPSLQQLELRHRHAGVKYENQMNVPASLSSTPSPTKARQVNRTVSQVKQIKHDFASNVRARMQDTMQKMSEQAMERNRAQVEPARTVLHDPLRSHRLPEPMTPILQTAAPDPVYNTSIDPQPHIRKSQRGSVDLSVARSGKVIRAAVAVPRKYEHASSADSVKLALDESGNLPLSVSMPYSAEQKIGRMVTFDDHAWRPPPVPQTFSGPFFIEDSHCINGKFNTSKAYKGHEKVLLDQQKALEKHDDRVNDWWNGGQRFSRQEDYYQRTTAAANACVDSVNRDYGSNIEKFGLGPFDVNRVLISVLENLVEYSECHDQRGQGSTAPEWCVERSPGGNKSFFDTNWGTPPARVGRDMRYRNNQQMNHRRYVGGF